MAFADIDWSAKLSAVATTIALGDVLCHHTDGTSYVKATIANYNASNAKIDIGVALAAGDPDHTVPMQTTGYMVAAITGIAAAPGVGRQFAVVTDLGRLARSATTTARTVGYCDETGGVLFDRGAAASGSLTLGGDVTGAAGANTVGGILNAVVPALAGNVGKALVLASLGAFAFQAIQAPITWANDLAGSIDSSQNVVALTGSAGSVLVRGTAVLTFGSGAAAAGDTRHRNATQVASARNAGGTLDLGLVRTTNLNTILFGSHDDFGSSNATGVYLCAITNVNAVINGVTQLTIDASALTVGPGKIALSTGPTLDYGTGVPATSANNGSLRLRTDGTGGADGLYTRQGGAWFAVGGGGTPGGSSTQVQFNNSGAFGGAANVTYASGILNVAAGLTVGSGTFATAGDIRTAINTTIIATRNNANSGNLTVLSTTTGDAVKLGGSLVTVTPGILEIGTTVSTTGAVRLANAAVLAWRNAANSGDISAITVNSSNLIAVGAGVDFGSNFAQFGTSAASAGCIRVAKATAAVVARNSANSGNHTLISTGSGATDDYIFIGSDDAIGTSSAAAVAICASGAVILAVGGSTLFAAASTYVYTAGGTSGLSLGDTSITFNSGTNVLLFNNGTAPSTVPTNGTYLFSNSGRLGIWSSNDPAGAPVPVHMILDSVRDVTGSSHDADLKVIVDLPTLTGVTRYIQLFA